MLRRESSTLINTEHKSTRLRKGRTKAREDGRSVESAEGGGKEEGAKSESGYQTALLGVTISVAIVGWKLVDGRTEKGTRR